MEFFDDKSERMAIEIDTCEVKIGNEFNTYINYMLRMKSGFVLF